MYPAEIYTRLRRPTIYVEPSNCIAESVDLERVDLEPRPALPPNCAHCPPSPEPASESPSRTCRGPVGASPLPGVAWGRGPWGLALGRLRGVMRLRGGKQPQVAGREAASGCGDERSGSRARGRGVPGEGVVATTHWCGWCLSVWPGRSGSFLESTPSENPTRLADRRHTACTEVAE